MPHLTWNTNQVYKQAWHVCKNHPKLWILGLAVSTFAASTSYNSSSSSGSKSDSSPAPSPAATTLPLPNSSTGDEFQTALSTTAYRLQSNLLPAIRKVPLASYFIFGGEMLVIAIIGVIIQLTAVSWSEATLIAGIHQAGQGSVNLTQASRTGLNKIKTFIAIHYLPWLTYWGIVLLLLVIGVALAIGKLVWLIPFLVIGLIIYTVIYFNKTFFAQIWAYRTAVISDFPYKESYLKGVVLADGRRGDMLFLGIINFIIDALSNVVTLIISVIAAIPAIIHAVQQPNPTTIITAVIMGIISLIIASPILTARAAFMNTFKYAVWHFAYAAISTANQQETINAVNSQS